MNTAFNIVKKYIVLSQIYVLICVAGVPYVVSGMKKDTKIMTVNKTGNAKSSAEDRYKVGGLGMEEYIKGVVAAEMPASFPIEALKAQAVAARTYAVRAVDNADFELMPSDIGQAYITAEDMKNNWGENFDAFYEKVTRAVDETAGEIMEYDGEPILAVFHSTSCGTTETAGNIWNYDLPYLESKSSIGDTYAPNFESVKVIKEEDIIALLSEKYENFSGKAESLFSSIKINDRSDAGYITDISIGGSDFTGKEVREALGLRSTNFDVKKAENGIAFITKGYGHGAGMSQYGAKYMAEQGSDYREILLHYYSDITIGEIK